MNTKVKILIICAVIVILGIGIYGLISLKNANPNNQQNPNPPTEKTVKLPVAIYSEHLYSTNTTERSWETVRIWQKVGDNDPEILIDKIGGLNEYPIGFTLSPDNKTLLINLESKLSKFNFETKKLSDIYTPKYGLQGIHFINSKEILILDQKYASQDFSYIVKKYNLTTDMVQTLAEGNTKMDFAITHFYEKENKLLLFSLMGEATQPWILDLSNKQISALDKLDPGWYSISANGKFLYRAEKYIDDVCNDFMGSGPAFYSLHNPITGKKVGGFGSEDKKVTPIAFSPDENTVLFSSVIPKKNKESCANKSTFKYYTTDLQTGTTLEVPNYQTILKSWNADKPFTELSSEGENYFWSVDGRKLKEGPDTMIGTFYKDIPVELAQTASICSLSPTSTSIGRTNYPKFPQYFHLDKLGEIFTAYECDKPYDGIFGVENKQYELGLTVTFNRSVDGSIYNVLMPDLGFSCSEDKPKETCMKWSNPKPIKIEDLLKLKRYYFILSSTDCINCG